MVDMILINIVQLLKNSIEIKAHYYSENELKSIFYLICALILDKNFQSDISLLGELNSLLAELFRNEQIDLNELTDTLSNLIRLEGHQTDEKKSTINILHHRLLFLLNALNSSRRVDQIKLLSTKLSVVILQDIFAVFGNDESQSQSRNKWDETKIELVIDSLEKHAISTFTSSSYAMSNILHAIHIIIDNYFPTLTDHKLVLAYIERLKAVFHKTNQEVRDQMSFNGRAQIKATLCHYSRLCELYLNRYQSLLTRSTSMMSSSSSNFDQSDKDKENKKV